MDDENKTILSRTLTKALSDLKDIEQGVGVETFKHLPECVDLNPHKHPRLVHNARSKS